MYLTLGTQMLRAGAVFRKIPLLCFVNTPLEIEGWSVCMSEISDYPSRSRTAQNTTSQIGSHILQQVR